MTTKAPKGIKFVARLLARGTIDGYWQDSTGAYWTRNPQTGWVKVPPNSPALAETKVLVANDLAWFGLSEAEKAAVRMASYEFMS